MPADKPDLNRDALARARAIAAEMFPEDLPAKKALQYPSGSSSDERAEIARGVIAAEMREMDKAAKAQVLADARAALAADPIWNPGGLPLPQLSSSYLVDDVEYPSVTAMLVTLRAVCADRVHGRNLCNAIAKALGLEIGDWDSVKWQETIRKSWVR